MWRSRQKRNQIPKRACPAQPGRTNAVDGLNCGASTEIIPLVKGRAQVGPESFFVQGMTRSRQERFLRN